MRTRQQTPLRCLLQSLPWRRKSWRFMRRLTAVGVFRWQAVRSSGTPRLVDDYEDGLARLPAALFGLERGAPLAQRPASSDHRAELSLSDSLSQLHELRAARLDDE